MTLIVTAKVTDGIVLAADSAGSFFDADGETIGGPTELAAVTKHEGFKWIARKHYYTADLNRETNHGR